MRSSLMWMLGNKMSYNHFKHKFAYTCLQCGRQVSYVIAHSGCPECSHSLFKVARRGTGYPNAFTPPDEEELNPYKHVPIMTPGDEDDGGGLGTRVRGKGFPKGWTANDEYEDQRDDDLPEADHMFMDGPPWGEGVNDGTFYDPSSALSNEQATSDELYRKTPVGPHNMQKNRNVFDRVRKQQRGT